MYRNLSSNPPNETSISLSKAVYYRSLHFACNGFVNGGADAGTVGFLEPFLLKGHRTNLRDPVCLEFEHLLSLLGRKEPQANENDRISLCL